MKKTILFIAVMLFGVNVFAQSEKEVIRLSEPVMVTDQVEVFGSEMDLNSTADAQSLSEAIASDISEDEILVTTEISQVCDKKGCFFVAQEGDVSARITFIDYSFFIPTNSAGKTVTVRGVLSEKVLSEEQAKHYAEDAGNDPDAIKGEQKEYAIVATSVAIPKD